MKKPITDDCLEPSYYTADHYQFRRATRSDRKACERKAEPNQYGKYVTKAFDIVFKDLKANRHEEKIMSDLYVHQDGACEFAYNRYIKILEKYKAIKKDKAVSDHKRAARVFDSYRKKFTLNSIRRLTNKANKTQHTDSSEGIGATELWLGEKGVGKTTHINYLLLNKRDFFRKKKIIPIRHSVYFDQLPEDLSEIKLQLYKKIERILKSHYYKKKSPMSSLTGNKYERYVEGLVKTYYDKGWKFLFFIDNIDQLHPDSDEVIKSIFEMAVRLSRKPCRSVVVIVARNDTFSGYYPVYEDLLRNIKKYYINPPNFNELFRKRMDYIAKNYNDNVTVRHENLRNVGVSFSRGYLARKLAELLKIRLPYDPDKFLIPELSNYNLRNVFEMISTALSTHITDLTDIPVYNLILKELKQKKSTIAKYNLDKHHEDKRLSTDFNYHLLIWALMLRNNYLYYGNSPDRTWIMNIYDTKTGLDSIWLKRLILDYFIFKKTQDKALREESVNFSSLQKVFVDEFKYSKEELSESLSILCNRERQDPYLVYSYNEYGEKEYFITTKGEVMARLIVGSYTYYEMILEDMLLPTSDASDYSINIDLVPYEPLDELSHTERKNLTVKFFTHKRSQLRKLLEYLKARERYEKIHHNDFKSKSSGFQISYFPELEKELIKQEGFIAKSLGV